jgi:NodT family efflux transporter outer membrane factor (OMF) lipoprotein
MRSEYQQPELSIPESWGQDSLPTASTKKSYKWWTLFEDPQLNALVDKVMVSNSDLATATLVLRKALLEAGINENDKIPSLSFSQDSSYEYDLDSETSDTTFGSTLSLSYELDLWNRVDALADAGELAARASYESREETAQNLVVTTAMLYWKVGYLNQRLALVKQNIADTKRIESITATKYKSGATTRLEVLESTQNLFEQQVQLSELQQEMSETQNAISILLNQPLQDTGITIDRLSAKPIPDIKAGIPSDLLLRRSDVKASLYLLKSSLATKDAVDAGYWPTFTLTAALNTSSSGLLELLQNPVATLGSGIVLPFLEWNEMELKQSISEVDYQMAVVDYRDTLYKAFEEIANLLNTKEHYLYQGNVYSDQFINAQEIERIYASRYKYGESDMVDWINVMESRRSIESTLLENRYDQLVIQIKLYQSLGGSDVIPEA